MTRYWSVSSQTYKRIRPSKRKNPTRTVIPTRVFFAFVGNKVVAPTGYGFNGRGDLINLRKREVAR